jgi:ferredoxin
MRPSTRAFALEARRTPGYSLLDWVHGQVYARWPYLYIGIATGEHPLAPIVLPVVRGLTRLLAWRPAESPAPGEHDESAQSNGNRATFADEYHGKVVPLDAAARLVTVGEDIQLTDLEQVIPYASARDIILMNPDHIVALDCPCRASRRHPCKPLDICLIVGEPFAGFVAEHHARRSRWITPQEAVEILRAEDERGHVHHAFFKDAMLGRFYAICNCCACCCGAMQAHQHGTPMLASSGYVGRVDTDLCIGCGDCSDFCQFGALSVSGTFAALDPDACMGCGVCVSKCAYGALSLVRDPVKGEPLEIHELLQDALQAM